MKRLKQKTYNFLRWTEQWTKTDMVYLAKGGFWLTGSKTVGTITSLILAITYANLLSKETYATYKYIMSFAGIIGFTALPGLTTSLNRAIIQGFEGDIKKVIKTKFKFSLLGFFTLLIISLYYLINNNYQLGLGFLVFGFFFPLNEGLLVYSPYLEAKKKFKEIAQFNSIQSIISTAIVVLVLIKTNNLILFLLFILLTKTILQHTFSFITFKKNKLNNKTSTDVISFGKHLSFMGILGLVAEHIDKIIIWHFLGPNELAIYSFATIPVTHLQSFMKSINIIAYPKIAELNKKTVKKTLTKKIKKFALTLVPIILLYITFAPLLFQIIFPEYIDSLIYSQLFAITIILLPFRLLAIPLVMHAKKKHLYIQNTASHIIRIALLLLLIPTLQIWGAIIATIIARLASNTITYYYYKKL